MRDRVWLHYLIGAMALGVMFWAMYLLIQNPERMKFLAITIVGCLVVAVGQFLIIRQKRKIIR